MHRIQLNRRRSTGVGLVEIMVALVIGMFGVLVMMQVLSVTEEQKRTTTSGNDAMNEGVLGLYTMQTDLRMAGFGITDPKLLGCGVTLRAGVTLNQLAPVLINSPAITGHDANTDTLIAFYGNTLGSPQGENIYATGNKVQTPAAFASNDWVVPAAGTQPVPCNLALQRVVGLNGDAVDLVGGASLTSGHTLFNLGQNYRAVGYAIRGGNLTMCDFSTQNCAQANLWVAIANNMVSMRAQYGIDTRPVAILPAPPPNGIIPAVIDSFNQTTPVNVCDWSRTPAVRVVLVARSTQAEKDDVTTAAPVWEGSVASLGNTATPIVLTGLPDWQKYRYKVFQTTVPLRNLSWMGVKTGC